MRWRFRVRTWFSQRQPLGTCSKLRHSKSWNYRQKRGMSWLQIKSVIEARAPTAKSGIWTHNPCLTLDNLTAYACIDIRHIAGPSWASTTRWNSIHGNKNCRPWLWESYSTKEKETDQRVRAELTKDQVANSEYLSQVASTRAGISKQVCDFIRVLEYYPFLGLWGCIQGCVELFLSEL